VESLTDQAKSLWIRYRNEIIHELAALELEGKEHPVLHARTYLRTRYETKGSEFQSPLQLWVTIELRKDAPVLCVKCKQDGVTWQMSSLPSCSKMLMRHAIVFKAMLLAAKHFETCDFLAFDFFKALRHYAHTAHRL
jgi:hypothetical protein